ncbi:hypothetical protein TRVL_06049 [Trypanosoma vivax]|nr:hypothetical protein TRVL_06049 [Trypanosoma vivax]
MSGFRACQQSDSRISKCSDSPNYAEVFLLRWFYDKLMRHILIFKKPSVTLLRVPTARFPICWSSCVFGKYRLEIYTNCSPDQFLSHEETVLTRYQRHVVDLLGTSLVLGHLRTTAARQELDATGVLAHNKRKFLYVKQDQYALQPTKTQGPEELKKFRALQRRQQCLVPND